MTPVAWGDPNWEVGMPDAQKLVCEEVAGVALLQEFTFDEVALAR